MKHQLAGIIGDRSRQVISTVLDEIVTSSEEYVFKLLPITDVPAAILYNERISGHGGKTGERALGSKGKAISASSSAVYPYSPGAYQEFVQFNEKDLLILRKFGSMGERGVTGLTSGELDHLSRAGKKLQLRLKNRMQGLAWDAIFNGTFVWENVTYDFGIPGGNTIAAGTDWSVGGTTGKPLSDLWTLQNTNAKLRKYKIKEYIMNPVTATYALKCDEVKNVLINNSAAVGDLNKVAQILFPGLAPIKIIRDNWQDESVVSGEIVAGDAQYFVPDDKVLIVVELSGALYTQFGELQLTENINDPSSTLAQPAVGLYTFVDEKGLEDRKAPHVDVVAGFNGGPNLMRAKDIFIATV